MHLRKYQPSDFTLLAQWVTSPALLFQFAGTDFSYPLTQIQIQQYQSLNPECSFYVACTPDNKPFAFGEIIPQENNIPRLGRLLIGDTKKRGKGLGAIFVQLLVEECIRLYNCTQIELYVLTSNIQAIRCYEKVGFQFLPNSSFELIVHGEAYTIDKMQLQVGQ
jgi:RimJ/RimL family protein N-acetyltransferase